MQPILPVGEYPTVNQIWADLLLTTLARSGVEHICLAPGSRSTPLTEIAARQPALLCHTHFDERGLGFFALGLIKASQKPVAVITTSGTAVANLYPAVIEAALSGLPLIVLSADRPPELLECGANQAIIQQGIFAGYPVAQLALPRASLELSAQWLLNKIEQALYQQQSNRGPVHINCMFAEPLYQDSSLKPEHIDDYLVPLGSWQTRQSLYLHLGQLNSTLLMDAHWPEIRRKKGLILVGQQDSPNDELVRLGNQLGWPVLCDIQSQLKGAPGTLDYYDQALNHPGFYSLLSQAEVILQFGGRILSKRLNQFISDHCWYSYWLIAPGQSELDPSHQSKKRFQTTATTWLQAHPGQDATSDIYQWQHDITQVHQQVEVALSNWHQAQAGLGLTEISICHALPRLMPANIQLMIGNSMPIRLMDMLAESNTRPVKVYCNRGASGIDGQTATAAGIAAYEPERPTLLLTGDLSFLHDLNSLALLRHHPGAFVIILLNNDGGGIFNMLPVNSFEGLHRDYYQLPHQLNAAGACKMFSFDYLNPLNQQEFELDLTSALQQPGVTLLEFSLPNDQASNQLRQLGNRIRDLA